MAPTNSQSATEATNPLDPPFLNLAPRQNPNVLLQSAEDKDRFAQALDQIHNSASQSETLTTFEDLAPPGSSISGKDENLLAAQSTPATIGNLYNRIKTSVAGPSAGPPKQRSDEPKSKAPEDTVKDKSSSKNQPEPGKSAIATLRQVSDKDKIQIDGASEAEQPTSPLSSRSLTSHASAPVTPKPPNPKDSLKRDDRPSASGINVAERAKRLSTSGSSIAAKSSKSLQGQDPSKSPLLVPRDTISDSFSNSAGRTAARITSPSLRPSEPNHDVDEIGIRKSIDSQRTTSSGPSSQSLKSFATSLQLPGYSVPSAAGTQESRLRTERGNIIAPAPVADGPAHSLASVNTPKQDPAPNTLIYQMQRKILSRDFWMKDENAKFCFNCGESFSTFRRKHHCRVCGQIYCNSCTNLISGKPFGHTSKLRVCRTCEGMLVEDDSSEYSEDEESNVALASRQIRFSDAPTQGDSPSRANREKRNDIYKLPNISTFSMASRRPRELRRTLTSGTESARHSPLSRPPSSRSLKSLAGRPRSSSHKSHPSRNQHMRSLSFISGDSAPFHRNVAGQEKADQHLPAFHTDSIIDPDLAPFVSDSESSDDAISTISSALISDTNDNNAMGFQNILGALRRGGRPRTPAKNLLEGSPPVKDIDNSSVSNSRNGLVRRHLGGRTLSAGSLGNYSASPHIIRSDNLLKRSDSMYSILDQSQSQTNDASGPKPPVDSLDHEQESQQPKSGMAELNSASLEHVKKLLRQFLTDTTIGHAKLWERALLPIFLKCAEQVDPSIHRGDDIDIRHYIKLKKAPGGLPHDSKYVSGIVFTNNVALRDMPRNIKNPRILLVSFPLVYARREDHFMSLEGVIAQEREYLRNLSKRIIALRPTLMLAQGQVSGLLLGFLCDGGVTVVQNVKNSVLLAASRFAQTRIVSSVDKLTMDPSNLGRCGRFDVRTNMYNNSKKSHVYLSGCQKDLGCTIVLRGADRKTLSKMKWITEFMCYVVYNLKLETCLLRDQFTSLPPSREAKVFSISAASSISEVGEGGASAEEGEWKNGIGPYDKTVRELRNRILSASPFVTLPAPYLLLRGQEQEFKMSQLKRLQLEEFSEISNDAASSKQAETQKFELVRPEMVYTTNDSSSPHVHDILQAIHKSEYEKAAHSYEAIQRRWEMYINGVVEPYSPLTHQKIVALFSIISMPSSDACVGPDLLGLDFYQEHDIEQGCERDMPLGEYIERLCDQVDLPCMAGNCEQKMLDHQRQYVHGDGQISVSIQKFDARYRSMENTILMWSVCRICEQETQITRMSPDSWRYSFAKYLELSFWTLSLKPRAGTCIHNIHRDHIRYFGFKNLAVLVQYDPINLVEVRVPRGAITWAVDKDLRLKNEQFQKIEDRMTRFLASVKLRLKKIKLDSIEPEKYDQCKAQVESLIKRVGEEQELLVTKLQEKYMESMFFEIVPLNRAVRFLQEKVAEWDSAFADLEKDYFPSEKDLRKLAAIQLRDAIMEREDVMPINIVTDENLNEKSGGEAEMQATDRSTNNSPEQSSPYESLNQSTELTGDVHVQLDVNAEQSPIVQNLDLAVPTVAEGSHHTETGVVPRNQLHDLSSSNIHDSKALGNDLRVPISEDKTIPPAQNDLNQRSERRPRHRGLHVAPSLIRSRTQPATPKTAKTELLDNELSATRQSPRVDLGVSTPTLPASKIPLAIPTKPSEYKTPGGSGSTAIRLGKTAMHSMIPRVVGGKRLDSKVSMLAKHFEELSREFERERIRERRQRAARTRQSRAFPMASVKPIVEVFKDANEAVRERELGYDDPTNKHITGETQPRANVDINVAGTVKRPENENDNTGEHSEDNTIVASYPASEYEIAFSEADTAALVEGNLNEVGDRLEVESIDSQEQALDIGKQEKSSLMKMLTSFWSERSASGWIPLEYPLAATDHIFVDSDLIVREDEPSSLIAFALDSDDYKKKIQKFWERANAADKKHAESNDGSTPASTDIDVERIMLGKTATHMRYQFQSGSARMQCKVFYAESFDAIRRKCGVADRFVESLSRCLKWDSKGGKTKSLFLKTLDERFVLKSISPVETQAFLKFAPDYFDYMSKCLFHNLPSALAKMLGFYQVVIKNPITGTEFNWFLQVMENVFYEGPSNRMFDLKGSMRNRKVQSTGEKDEVLLDENLLDYISQSPIYVRNHSNTILASSIQNDTLFCSKQNVMDYSLIVGLYDDRKELLVGIIDYIRTYTWDKKLESWIKDRGKHKATVRSPKEYRTRFRRSIPRYFPLAPSCWQIFGMQRIEEARARLEENDVEDNEGEDSDVDVAVVGNETP